MRLLRSLVSPLLLVLLLPGLTLGSAFAMQEVDGRDHAVAIHPGTCQELDLSPAHELGTSSPAGGDVAGVSPVDDQQSMIGFPGAVPVASLDATIGATFGDVFTDDPPHSVVIHSGPEIGDNPVACGELGGVEDDGRIIVSILPVEGSRFAGVGIFDEDDAGFLGLGDDEVNVTVYILTIDTAADIDAATPAPATPVSGGEGEEGFVNQDWFVDVAWLQERLDVPVGEETDGEPIAVIGVFAVDDQPEATIPNTAMIEPQVLTPVSTSEEDIEDWRVFLMSQVMLARPMLDDDVLDTGTMLVLYDDGNMNAAALWWALDYLGHDNKRILDGGVQAWSDESDWATDGLPAGITGQPIDPDQIPESFGDGLNTDVLATIDDVEAALEDAEIVIVDVRSAEEYAAGHIPGSVNIPHEENLANGSVADSENLRQLYADAGVGSDARLIVYGGDGMNAQVAYFTLGLLGYDNVAVYPGGWTEWSQFPALPREQGE